MNMQSMNIMSYPLGPHNRDAILLKAQNFFGTYQVEWGPENIPYMNEFLMCYPHTDQGEERIVSERYHYMEFLLYVYPQTKYYTSIREFETRWKVLGYSICNNMLSQLSGQDYEYHNYISQKSSMGLEYILD